MSNVERTVSQPETNGAETLLEYAGRHIRARIMASNEGAMLSEAALARELGVSRSLVRLSMAKAVTEGLVRRIPGKGVVVTPKVRETRTVVFHPVPPHALPEILDAAIAAVRSKFPLFELQQPSWVSPQDDVISLLVERVHSRNVPLQPLDPVIERYPDLASSAFRPGVVDIFKRDGRLLALPLTVSPAGMRFNKEVFARAGVPEPQPNWSWEDLLKIAPALQKEGGAQWALAVSSSPRLYLTIARAFGAQIIADPNSLWNLQSAAAVEAARFFARLRPYSLFSGDPKDLGLQLRNGKIAILRGGLFTPSPSSWLGSAPMPEGCCKFTWLASSGIGLGRHCRNIELAYAFIHELIGPGAQAIAQRLGMVPTMKNVGDAKSENAAYLAAMSHAQPLYELSSRAVHALLSSQLDHLGDPEDAESFCRNTERLINDFLAHPSTAGEEDMA